MQVPLTVLKKNLAEMAKNGAILNFRRAVCFTQKFGIKQVHKRHRKTKLIGTFRSDHDNDYEYEFSNVSPVRMRDCVRLSRQLVLSSKSRRRLDANYENFNKSRPLTTSSLQVQRRVKRLVFKGADIL